MVSIIYDRIRYNNFLLKEYTICLIVIMIIYHQTSYAPEFHNILNHVEYFQDYITSCHSSSIGTYIPYASIVQSSGYGRSRLIKEYTNRVYTLYLNLGIDRKCFSCTLACTKDFIFSFQKAKDP